MRRDGARALKGRLKGVMYIVYLLIVWLKMCPFTVKGGQEKEIAKRQGKDEGLQRDGEFEGTLQ